MKLNNYQIPIEDGSLFYIPEFIEEKQSTYYLNKLVETIHWQQEHLKIYGKEIPFPRLTAWYGDEGVRYKYSGKTYEPNYWTKDLLELKNAVSVRTNQEFNSVLLNYYRNGNDSMSWHADDEFQLGVNPYIASLNFGAERKFKLKHNKTKKVIDINLENGSLLIMAGTLQHYWKHAIPKTKKKKENRVNLTFRKIKTL